MKKCKVLHIAPGFKYGGIESRMVDWYSAMDRENIQFDVIKVTPNEANPLVEQIEQLGGTVFSIPPLGLKTAFSHFKAVRGIMDKGNYDVVHSHSLAYGWYPLWYAKRKGIKTRVLHSRTTSYNPGDKHLFVSNILGKMAIPCATHFFACSEEAGQWAFGNRAKATVVRNGIFLERYRFNEDTRNELRSRLGLESAYVIGYVGRFSSAKNIPFLLDVFAKVLMERPDAVLLLVGDYDNEIGEQVHHRAEQLGILSKVLFVGRQENIPNWLQCFDAFAAPSLFEGFGTVALEAQANGLPCVLSTGFPKSIQVLDSVKFCNLADPQAWVDALVHADEAGRTGQSIELAEKAGYDVNTTADWLERFYLEDYCCNGCKEETWTIQ